MQEQTAVVDQDCATGPHGMWSRLFSNLQFDAGATAAVSISAGTTMTVPLFPYSCCSCF